MLYIFSSDSPSIQLSEMINAFCHSYSDFKFVTLDNLPSLKQHDKVLFAWEADICGVDTSILKLIHKAYLSSPKFFSGCKGSILCFSKTIFYTKYFSSHIAFLTNNMGLEFIGKPMVEAVESYNNFKNKQKLNNISLKQLCLEECMNLGKRLKNDKHELHQNPKITAVHASHIDRSNTYALMKLILDNLSIEKSIFSLAEERIMDCRGCDFEQCMNFSNHGVCYYEGDKLKDIFKSLDSSQALIVACPNYNDSMPANYFAMINRMTYIYRQKDFSDKYLYAIIVSANSGFDMVAGQIISAFCFNKGFRLAPNFALMEQANEPLSILNLPHIKQSMSKYAKDLEKKLKEN